MRPLLLSLVLVSTSSSQLPIPDSRYRTVRATTTTPPSTINPFCQVLGTSAGGTTSDINTTGANFIAVSPSRFIADGTLSDSKSNTWIPLTIYNDSGGNVRTQILYAENPTVGANHNFTYSGVNIFVSLCVIPLSGMLTSSVFDTGTDAGFTGVYGNTCQAGSITPSSSNKVVIAVATTDGLATATLDSGYTNDAGIPNDGVFHKGASIAHLYQTPNGSATNPTWTGTGGTGCAIAAFKAAL